MIILIDLPLAGDNALVIALVVRTVGGRITLIAGGVLGDVAGKMLLHDQFLVRRFGDAPAWIEVSLRSALAVAIMLIGWHAARRPAVAGVQTAPLVTTGSEELP